MFTSYTILSYCRLVLWFQGKHLHKLSHLAILQAGSVMSGQTCLQAMLSCPVVSRQTPSQAVPSCHTAGWFCASRGEVDRMAKEYPDDATSAAVIGCGPVGLMAILAAQAQGAEKVTAQMSVCTTACLTPCMQACGFDSHTGSTGSRS